MSSLNATVEHDFELAGWFDGVTLWRCHECAVISSRTGGTCPGPAVRQGLR